MSCLLESFNMITVNTTTFQTFSKRPHFFVIQYTRYHLLLVPHNISNQLELHLINILSSILHCVNQEKLQNRYSYHNLFHFDHHRCYLKNVDIFNFFSFLCNKFSMVSLRMYEVLQFRNRLLNCLFLFNVSFCCY